MIKECKLCKKGAMTCANYAKNANYATLHLRAYGFMNVESTVKNKFFISGWGGGDLMVIMSPSEMKEKGT